MTYTMEPYSFLPCELKVFMINGKDAFVGDFGYMVDCNSDEEEGLSWSCKCMKFVPYLLEMGLYHPSITELCDEYGITIKEYVEIINKLEDILYVGSCECCV